MTGFRSLTGWPTAGQAAVPAILAIAFAVLYLPSLSFGYRGDDFRLLTTPWSAFLFDPFAVAGRPMLSLSCVLLAEISPSSGFQHAVNVALFAGIVLAGVAMLRRRGFPPVALLFLVAALCHPGFLWAVTWIAQRSDLLLLFTCLAITGFESRASPRWLVLAAASKSPFVFQNLAFAFRYYRQGRVGAALQTLVCVPLFLYFGYVTYYATAVDVGGHGLFLLDPESTGHLAIVAVLRSIKILEGLFYTFVPVSAYALSVPAVLISGALWAAAWTLIFLDIFRSGVRLKDLRDNPNFIWMATTGLLLGIPYAFSSGLRIYVPATVFLYLAVGALARPRRIVVVSIAAIAAIHLVGVLLNYPASRTQCFELDPRHEGRCQSQDVPAERWNRLRSQIVDQFVLERLN